MQRICVLVMLQYMFATSQTQSDEYEASNPCLPSAILTENRQNITIDGVIMPLGVWQLNWPMSLIAAKMFEIIIEEVLGYHVLIIGLGTASASAIYALAGCQDGKDCNPEGSAISTSHVSFDVWESAAKVEHDRYKVEHPHRMPSDLGSIGYTGTEGIFFAKSILDEALAETGLGLDFYRSYDARYFDVKRFFSDHRDINVSNLSSCHDVNERNEVMPQLVATYQRHFPSDIDGVEQYMDAQGEERVRLHCPGSYWWYSPACRYNVSRCIPLLTVSQGWGAKSFIQRATHYNMPIALGFAKSWSTYVKLAMETFRILVYWYIPEVSFDLNRMAKLQFPEHNMTEYDDDFQVTQLKAEVIGKWAHKDLEHIAKQIFKVASDLDLPLNVVMSLLNELETGKGFRTVACDYLKNSEQWKRWLPDPTDCDVGTGLANASGHFVFNRSSAQTCKACSPGRHSLVYHDEQGSSFECRACSLGRFSGAFRAEACSHCPAGRTQDLSGQSLCSQCEKGKYASANAPANCTACFEIQQCISCPRGRFSSSPASYECDSCSLGTYADQSGMSECVVCPVGSFSDSRGKSSCSLCEARLAGSTSARASQSILDCFCPKGSYAVESESMCIECGNLQKTENEGATSPSDCYFGLEFYVVVLLPIVCVILMVIIFVTIRFVQRTMKRVYQDRGVEKIFDCILNSRELVFPLVLMNVSSFKSLGRLVPFEEALDKQFLRVLSTVQHVENFKMYNRIVFFSHQWLGWDQPDPGDVHYNAIVIAIDAILQQMEWDGKACYVWVDYHSVPQESKRLQQMAIITLPFFASLASLFVIVAPDAQHADTQLLCNFETYQRRMWCRAEVFSFYCRRGLCEMYRMVKTDNSVRLARLDETEIDDAISVFEGDCTCCARNHEGMTSCDKELLRDVFIGTYADLLWMQRALPSRKTTTWAVDKVHEIAKRIHTQKERLFPRYFETTFWIEKKAKSTRLAKTSISSLVQSRTKLFRGYDVRVVKKSLFGDLLEILETMIQGNAEELKNIFVDESRIGIAWDQASSLNCTSSQGNFTGSANFTGSQPSCTSGFHSSGDHREREQQQDAVEMVVDGSDIDNLRLAVSVGMIKPASLKETAKVIVLEPISEDGEDHENV